MLARKLAITLVFFCLMTLATADNATAQQWSTEQQEVISALEGCWDIWMEGLRSNDPEEWISKCSTEDATYWWSVEGTPNGVDFLRRQWETFAKQDERWVDLRPVGIRVLGNVAIVHFYGYWQAPLDGRSVVTEAKRTEVFQKTDGQWRLIAGHSTPVSQADAEPYR